MMDRSNFAMYVLGYMITVKLNDMKHTHIYQLLFKFLTVNCHF